MDSGVQKYLRYGPDNAKITAPPKFVINNVHVFDGHEFGDLGSVAVEQGKIVEDTNNAISIDGGGFFLIPGFIDSHAHPAKVVDMEAFREYGVTTAMEVGNPHGPAGKAIKDLVGLPDMYTAGYFAAAPDGGHAKLMDLSQDAYPTTPTEAVRFVAQRIAQGADYIKIVSETPGLDQMTTDTLVNQAKQNNMLTHIHAVDLESYRKARRAQPALMHHIPCDTALTVEEVAAGSDFAAVPTLAILKTLTDNTQPDNPEAFDIPIASAKAIREAGVPILAGSDACFIEGAPVEMPMGEGLHQEMELLVTAAGLRPVEALRAATVFPPKYFRLSDRGVVKPGFRADLVLLRSNPLDDITATRSIERVWLNGIEHRPKGSQIGQ